MGKGINKRKNNDKIEIEDNEEANNVKKQEKMKKLTTKKLIKKQKKTHLDEMTMEVEKRKKKIKKNLQIKPEEKKAVIFKEFIENSQKIPELKNLVNSIEKNSRGKKKRADKKLHYMKKKVTREKTSI